MSKLNQKNVLLALGIGVLGGYLLGQTLPANRRLTPDRALKNAKETFKENGPINGSWIYMKPEQLEKNGLIYDTYRGGISRNIDGENKQYDFHIDTKSGIIVDSQPAS